MADPSLIEVLANAMDAVLGIFSWRNNRKEKNLRLANRGLPNHCSNCGRDLRSVYDLACPSCGKILAEIDRKGDPSRQ